MKWIHWVKGQLSVLLLPYPSGFFNVRSSDVDNEVGGFFVPKIKFINGG